ncbi:hypothetical protein [Kordiimonas gwangyangensis]|uniref:hypothetical protein n=1 Tax=Kordiimonas gwangyangensis TaxID=288022 RepID=UPI00036DFC28|nr:hypothetical protein [Kordiimonas gwangyangensis]
MRHQRLSNLILSAAVLAFAVLPAHADGPITEPTHIFATDWGLTLKGDGTGFYNDLAQLIFSPDIGPIDYEILPYRRAKRHFFEEAGACFYPSSMEYLTTTGDMVNAPDFIESGSMLNNRIHLFAAPGKPAPRTKEDVNGKRVAYAMGSKIPYALQGTTALFIAVADEVDKAEMLLTGRVDIISAAMPDVKFVFDSLGAEIAPYDPDFVIAGSGIGIVCHNTPENALFLTQLDRRKVMLQQTGKLKRFLEERGLSAMEYITED